MARRFMLISVLGATLAVSAFCASTAQADLVSRLIGGDCGATSNAFASWGDWRSYAFLADGGFESGGAGWTFGRGANVVPGNEPFYLHGKTDRSSLFVPGGGVATSPALCIGLLTPGIRFVAVAPSGPATLHVRLIARGLLGVLTVLDGGTIQVGQTWAPTTIFSTLGSQLNLPLATKSIQVELTANGNVQVDDLYVDPFLMR